MSPSRPYTDCLQGLVHLTHTTTGDDPAMTALYRINEIEKYFLLLQSRYQREPNSSLSDAALPTPPQANRSLSISSEDRYDFLAIKFCLKRINEYRKKMKVANP